MKARGLEGVSRRKGCNTTSRDDSARPAPDLVEREFAAEAPDRLWVADITYMPTWEGFLYLAVVLDDFSRRIVGWAMASHLLTELVLSALNLALWQRQPEVVVHHSTRVEAERAIFEFIEGWYNPHRRHSALGYLSPISFDRQHARHKGGDQIPNVELSTEEG